uniref:VGF nerve growth factor inducible n=1 Tax=Denticeps clupeoides TaxID=299321 RepID=A0AAY4BLG9_9TELE
ARGGGRLTEKVTSRTTSQTVPVKEQPVVEEQKDAKQEAEPETREEEGEEELSPDEVKNLQTMLEQLQSLSTATKRERADSTGPRESRGFLEESDDYLDNEIKPTFRGYNLEEEARAKAEQEEVRRQAAEAQRAKAEEEKLADIASDMLLQYMGKQDNKNSKKNSLGMNAAEDKRSDEEEDADDDDIDPQTIDKLIEISSKLHLPADDVVDIISDVEKKKKKDQEFWLKPQRQPFRPYPSYPFYQKPYRGYYPIYFPPPNPKPRFYAKPSYSLNQLLGNSLDYDFDFPPKRRYRAWAQNLYFPNYVVPQPRTFTTVPMPKPLPQGPDYYGPMRPSPQGSDEELENFIEKVFLKRPRMFQ